MSKTKAVEHKCNDVKVETASYFDTVDCIAESCKDLVNVEWRNRRWFIISPYECFKNPVVPDYVKAADALEITIEKLQKAVEQTVTTMKKVGQTYTEIDEKATTAMKS